MKVAAILAGLVAVADASTLNYFTDPGCGTVATEVKLYTDRKNKFEGYPLGFATGVCTVLGAPVIRTEVNGGYNPAGDFKFKAASTFGLTCSEYGGWSFQVFGKEHKDCIVDEEMAPPTTLDEGSDKFTETLSGVASYCWNDNESNEVNNEGDPVYTKVDCNPNNASVAGLILGSIALILSLAAVGLAVVAGAGKKGGGQAPAKPAAPAVPAGGEEAAPQGSTTAAAAVGAATDA